MDGNLRMAGRALLAGYPRYICDLYWCVLASLLWRTAVNNMFVDNKLYIKMFKVDSEIGLYLFNGDTCPTGHISRPTQVGVSLTAAYNLAMNKPVNPIVLSNCGTKSSSKLHQLWTNSNVELHRIFAFLPLSPPGWRGIVITVRAGGRLPDFGTPISVTAWWIFSIRSSVELSRPVVVHCHGHLPICPIWACPWAKNLSNLPQIGSRLCRMHISETAVWIYPI